MQSRHYFFAVVSTLTAIIAPQVRHTQAGDRWSNQGSIKLIAVFPPSESIEVAHTFIESPVLQ